MSLIRSAVTIVARESVVVIPAGGRTRFNIHNRTTDTVYLSRAATSTTEPGGYDFALASGEQYISDDGEGGSEAYSACALASGELNVSIESV